jgi:hypothetical protein
MRGLLFTGGDTAGYSLGASEPAVQQAIEAHLLAQPERKNRVVQDGALGSAKA